jgi:hypothetical protein
MNAADKLEEKCKKYPDLKYKKDDSSITVFPADKNGFEVSYNLNGNTHSVSFLGWHEEFSNEDEALNCFAFGLSNECRLKVSIKGEFQYKWTVEAKDKNGNWSEDSTTGLLLFPFWKKTSTVILQNNFIANDG